MAAETVPYGRKTQKPSPVAEVHILWITAGLGCDGDSVSVTAATQPSIEDVLLGAIPGLPKVHLHNPVLAYENGDDFMKFWYMAEKGQLDPFVLVVEGSIPNEKIKKEGYWAALGTDPKTGQPITTNEWIDRLAPKALAVVAAGTCATYGGIHAMEGNPTGAMGLADYLGWDWKSKAGLPIVNVPGCPVQPDNFMETVALPAVSGGRTGADDSARRPAAAHLAVRQDGPRRLRSRRATTSRATSPKSMVRPKCLVKTRLLGPGGQLQRDQARLDGRHRRLPERRRHLHRLHHARLPRQVHAVHGRAAGRASFESSHRRLWPSDPRPAFDDTNRRPTRSRSGGIRAQN